MFFNLILDPFTTTSSSACAYTYSHSAARWGNVLEGSKERLGGYRTLRLEGAVVAANAAGLTK